jgi:ATP-dependent DNA helicase RecG
VDLTELATVIADLRSEGSDFAEVEVKRAADGFPQSVAPTISAFANTPGGGTLIFGLDESDNFSSVGVYDPAACKAALASLSRNGIEPAVNPFMWDFEFEGKPIVAAQVDELASSVKPCRVKGTGKAYLRSYDGDYELSQLEEQAFIANRDTPRFDQAVAGDSSKADLDGTLVESYVENCRATSPALARFDRDEILFRTGVVAGPDRRPTVAGLLALGVYPQQFFPNLVIQASVVPGPNDPPGTRAVDAKRFDGPIPLMLEQALSWVQRNTRTRVRFGYDGHGRDESEYPVEAVRELLSNALIHRDLGPYALGEAITLKIDNRQLILSNPGGLWGLSVDRLGLTGVTSARTDTLCGFVKTSAIREASEW